MLDILPFFFLKRDWNLTQLRQLTLVGMAAALQNQLEHAGTYDDRAFMCRLNQLLDHENMTWQSRKQESLIRQACFKLHGRLQDIDHQNTPRGKARVPEITKPEKAKPS